MIIAATTTVTTCDSAHHWCGLTSSGGRILLTVIFALVIKFLGDRLINRLVTSTADGLPHSLHKVHVKARAMFAAEPTDISERRRARAETIGSVLRSLLSFVVFMVALVMVLGSLGFNIAPLLAGAGIVGIALGFGAQSLVKDFLNGMFMILEDQYGVGDFIDGGTASGTVEAVGLRTTKVRDADGTIWYLRNGEILRVGNFSQGSARAVVDVPVSYAQPIERAQEVVLAAATSVTEDPAYADLVLEPPKMLGVQSYEEKFLTLRVAVPTVARQQDVVGRAIRHAVKDAFDREGIASPTAPRTEPDAETDAE